MNWSRPIRWKNPSMSNSSTSGRAGRRRCAKDRNQAAARCRHRTVGQKLEDIAGSRARGGTGERCSCSHARASSRSSALGHRRELLAHFLDVLVLASRPPRASEHFQPSNFLRSGGGRVSERAGKRQCRLRICVLCRGSVARLERYWSHLSCVTPQMNRSTSSLVLYIASDARVVAAMFIRSITGWQQ